MSWVIRKTILAKEMAITEIGMILSLKAPILGKICRNG